MEEIPARHFSLRRRDDACASWTGLTDLLRYRVRHQGGDVFALADGGRAMSARDGAGRVPGAPAGGQPLTAIFVHVDKGAARGRG